MTTQFERVMTYLQSQEGPLEDQAAEFGLVILLDALEDLLNESKLDELNSWLRVQGILSLQSVFRLGLLRYTARWRKEIPLWTDAVSKSYEDACRRDGLEAAQHSHQGLLL